MLPASESNEIQNLAGLLENLFLGKSAETFSKPWSQPLSFAPEAGSELQTLPDKRQNLSAVFSAYEKVLGQHEKMVDALFRESKNPSVKTGITQREIRIHCPETGRSGARFDLESPASEAIGFEIIPGWFWIDGTTVTSAVRLDVDPRTCELEAGASRRIRVHIDLAGSEARVGDRLEGFLDVKRSGAVLFRIWLLVEVGKAERDDSNA